MNVDIRRTDVELLERLSDAAMRAGHTQTAIEGYALALRLRMNLNPEASEDFQRGVRARERFDAAP